MISSWGMLNDQGFRFEVFKYPLIVWSKRVKTPYPVDPGSTVHWNRVMRQGIHLNAYDRSETGIKGSQN